jgi:hypothetical protein
MGVGKRSGSTRLQVCSTDNLLFSFFSFRYRMNDKKRSFTLRGVLESNNLGSCLWTGVLKGMRFSIGTYTTI